MVSRQIEVNVPVSHRPPPKKRRYGWWAISRMPGACRMVVVFRDPARTTYPMPTPTERWIRPKAAIAHPAAFPSTICQTAMPYQTAMNPFQNTANTIIGM
jgi:hypothetical protein